MATLHKSSKSLYIYIYIYETIVVMKPMVVRVHHFKNHHVGFTSGKRILNRPIHGDIGDMSNLSSYHKIEISPTRW